MTDKQIDAALAALKRIDDTHSDDIPPHVEVGEWCWDEVRIIRAALKRQRTPEHPLPLTDVTWPEVLDPESRRAYLEEIDALSRLNRALDEKLAALEPSNGYDSPVK